MGIFGKSLFIFLVSAAFFIFFIKGKNEPEQPEPTNPIVSNTEKIPLPSGFDSTENPLSEKDSALLLNVDTKLKEFYDIHDRLCVDSNKKYENLQKTLDNYIQRYISLFLVTSNLIDYEISDFDKTIAIDLEITISGQDLALLQNYSRSGKESSSVKDLSRLDAIFRKIAKLKQRSYLDTAFRNFYSFSTNCFFYLFDNPYFQHYIPFFIIFLATSLTYHFICDKLYLSFGIIANSMIIWDSLILYWKRIKEIDLKIYQQAMAFQKVREKCNTHEKAWYEGFLNFFRFSDECLEYFQSTHKKPVEEVSLFGCIVDTYSLYLIQIPAKILGASIRLFTSEVLELWSWPVRPLVSVVFTPFVVIVALFFILIICGKRLRLSFFGFGAEIKDSDSASQTKMSALDSPRETELIPLASTSESRPVRDIRKLRPWTKSRLNQQYQSNIRSRKKCLVGVRKFFSQLTNEISKSTELTEIVNPVNAKEITSSEPDVKLNNKIIKQE